MDRGIRMIALLARHEHPLEGQKGVRKGSQLGHRGSMRGQGRCHQGRFTDAARGLALPGPPYFRGAARDRNQSGGSVWRTLPKAVMAGEEWGVV